MANRENDYGGRDYYGGPDYTRDEFERGGGERGRGWDEDRYEREAERRREGGRRDREGGYDRWEGEPRYGRAPYAERDFGEREFGGRRGYEGGGYGRQGGSWRERPTYYGGAGGYGVGAYGPGYRGEDVERNIGRYERGGDIGRSGYEGGGRYGGSRYGGAEYGGAQYGGAQYGGAEYGRTPYGGSPYGAGYGRGEGTQSEWTRGRYVGRGPKGYRRSDDRIREEVHERLTMHPDVDASDIEVRVNEGVVTLTGVVEDRHQKRLAEDAVEDIFGVDDVRNELKVRHGFLASLTGEKASDREVSRTASREEGETRSRGARPTP